MTASLFYALPALALLVALALGHYPGERLIHAAAARRTRRPPRVRRYVPRRALFEHAPAPRGGDLLARALAGRAPPRTAPPGARP
ncbi:MAG: hypothetical protein QM729_16155 [Solirubrobacterales bacterium]